MRILVTGATGYVGGRLVPRLLDAGHEVRCVARHPTKITEQPWGDRVEIAPGDLVEATVAKEAAAGCDVVFHLAHGMGDGKGYVERDRLVATHVADAAEAAGVERIVYLSALGEPTSARSPFLASRHEVGRILASGPTPVTELRAAMIVGSGSMTFEAIRYLAEALPVMFTPRWTRKPCQPIAIRDVLDILVESMEHSGNRIVDVGGPDILTYEEMILQYAGEARLRTRRMIRVPVLGARLSAAWIGLVTPLTKTAARSMVENLRSDLVVRNRDSRIGRIGYRQAISRALDRLPAGVATRWTDAGAPKPVPHPGAPGGGTTYLDRQIVPTDASPDNLYWAFSRIGGDNGYYWLDWAWRMRGLVDQVVGGVGLRRGRRHPTDVRRGEAIDFWRVEAVEPGRSLLLRAEMRLPGDAWLEWEALDTEDGADLIQSAWFRPYGMWGRMYWWMMLPAHRAVFPRMAMRIAAKGEERDYACR